MLKEARKRTSMKMKAPMSMEARESTFHRMANFGERRKYLKSCVGRDESRARRVRERGGRGRGG